MKGSYHMFLRLLGMNGILLGLREKTCSDSWCVMFLRSGPATRQGPNAAVEAFLYDLPIIANSALPESCLHHDAGCRQHYIM